MWAEQALGKLLRDYSFTSVLDFGCGDPPPHRARFEAAGKKWTGLDLNYEAGPRLSRYDCLWLSHVAEHLPLLDETLGYLLDYRLRSGGILAITVPPLKHEIVGGHVSLWNAGLLLYRLALLGLDCSQASVLSEGYDISVIVRNTHRPVPELTSDHGDIDRLSHLLPEGYNTEGFDGRIARLNW